MGFETRRKIATALRSFGILLLLAGRANALQFESVQMPSSDALIVARGPIVPGDLERLIRALAAPSGGRAPVALALDSPGGNVVEARKMMTVIRERRLTVVLPPGAKCASACFLLFAASPRRIAASDAVVGVHSASVNGGETDMTLAVTTIMARDADELGVPPAILGKMVRTTPGKMEWLDRDDLISMRVTLYEGDLDAALRDAPKTERVAAMPRVVPPPAEVSPAMAGRADRRAWENWLATMPGTIRDGALFAQSQLPAPRPESCYGPGHVHRGDFTLGCGAAQQRLAPILAKMKANPDYTAGWNGAGPSVAVSEPVEQEYQGVSFCASKIAQLTVKILAGSNGTNRRALISFGPHATSPGLPRGAFMAEGTIAAVPGSIAIAPVKWITQPPNFAWFGINGASDDNGMTFTGRITGDTICTRFTLARQKASSQVR